MLKFQFTVLVAFAAGVVLGQDYDDYQPAHRPAPARINSGYSGPSAPKPTPIAILKQINRHNEDGSYTYGYESADGAFKIETKLPTGEVKGKYGYVDDTGKVRVVEYGATKYGFEPAGEGITVAPPTLVDETTNKDGYLLPEYSGSYYDDSRQQPISRPIAQQKPRPRPQPSFESYTGPQQFNPAPQPQRSPSPVPPRASIPGAAPVTTHNFEFGPSSAPTRSFAPAPRPQSRPPPPPSFARATPIEEDYDEPEPIPAPIRSAPRITYAQPAPRPQYEPIAAPAPRPKPQYAPRPAPAVGGRSGGILDQLSKDYALPQGGAAPLHDISFGYY